MSGKLAGTMPRNTSGTPQVLLGHHLRQLKLPTVLREYDKVARECARDGVDHPRYLLRLVELELIDRERRVVERRIRQGFGQKSLDTSASPPFPTSTRCWCWGCRCEFILRREHHRSEQRRRQDHVRLRWDLPPARRIPRRLHYAPPWGPAHGGSR
jgi:hypothetical protein